MIIRKFKPNDKEPLISLWKRVFPDDPPHNAPESVIPQKLAVDDLIFVIEMDSAIVGACIAGYDGHRGWLYAVAVDAPYRKNGLGADLVNYALNSLKRLGCQKVNIQIRSDNHAVEDFYKTLGFVKEERISMGKFL